MAQTSLLLGKSHTVKMSRTAECSVSHHVNRLSQKDSNLDFPQIFSTSSVRSKNQLLQRQNYWMCNLGSVLNYSKYDLRSSRGPINYIIHRAVDAFLSLFVCCKCNIRHLFKSPSLCVCVCVCVCVCLCARARAHYTFKDFVSAQGQYRLDCSTVHILTSPCL